MLFFREKNRAYEFRFNKYKDNTQMMKQSNQNCFDDLQQRFAISEGGYI